MAHSSGWAFDVGSFMVFLGDQQETGYRLMHRCVLECLTAAPVAGLQSYLRPFSTLTEARGPIYISPYGCKQAPLRNARLDQTLNLKELLKDGHCSVYKITAGSHEERRTRIFASLLAWTLSCWIIFGSILVSVYLSKRTTWIGTSGCASLTITSILIRLVENRCLEVKVHPPSAPKDYDAVVFMGRRNSCFVLEGSREEIARWTGFGLQVRSGPRYQAGEFAVRLASWALLIFIFATIPNGSTWDQVAFICINLLGQLNSIIGTHLNGSRCYAYLEKTYEKDAPTRTHVYGFLLRRFGDGQWVDAVSLIPGSSIWKLWRQRIIISNSDAKIIYDQCRVEDEKCTPVRTSGCSLECHSTGSSL